MKKLFTTRSICVSAVIAALYAALPLMRTFLTMIGECL